MPSTIHPQAKFDPIPPDLDLATLVEKTDNFDYVIRIHINQIEELGLDQFEKLLLLHVIKDGKPLVIEGWDTKLKSWLFNAQWLDDNCGKKQERVRDITNGVNIPMTIGHYLKAMDKLTNQWTPSNFRDSRRQRLYLKDIDCPDGWYQQLEKVMPSLLFYLNDSIGEADGLGATRALNAYGQPIVSKGVAPAGDLMSSLPPEMRAENMMCYIGHEGTYTPAHREMCASLGQNVMVETSDVEKGEQPGSSIWFMTETKERDVVSEYFLSMLGHDIEVESHFAQINAWKKAPFRVYVVEQKVGDFILIPPLAPHQVWNRGTRTMKAAWNRTTVETLELAIHEALPRARMVCRDEQYKNKAIIYYTLRKYYELLKSAESADIQYDEHSTSQRRLFQLKRDFKKLHTLYTEVLLTEMFSQDHPVEKHIEFLPFDSNVTCSYCRCNIFNRFLTCKTCVGVIEGSEDEDTYDICMECFAMGRSCYCISKLQWIEQWDWKELIQHHEEWRGLILEQDTYIDIDSSPPTLDMARSGSNKKSVAQICQEQLKLRPWRDISKPPPSLDAVPEDSDVEPECDDEGRLKRKKPKKPRRKSLSSLKTSSCHVCKKQEWNWKLAFCSECTQAYCYGVLWRAFDLMPQTAMENPNWKCPKCMQMCSCGACRKDPVQASGAYRPKGTLLGHDTKKVADPRSVESLVDFSRTNLGWLRGEGDDDPQGSQRMQTLMRRAEAEKARHEALEDDPAVLRNMSISNNSQSQDDAMAIDPQLQDGQGTRSKVTIMERDGDHTDKMEPLAQAPTANMVADDFQAAEARHFTHHVSHEHEEQSDELHTTTQEPFLTESSYPDPMLRGMGIGYYQQVNDSDRILYDAPDAKMLRAQDPNLAYPKLPSEPSQASNGVQKRKRNNRRLSNDAGDNAHVQFIQAQKKQKLSNAKSNDSYFKTANKLEGGTPRIVKLPLANRKEFLQDLQDHGRARSNHRSLRGSVNKNDESEINNPSLSPVIVTSDLRDLQKDDDSPEEDERRDDSDDEDFVTRIRKHPSSGVQRKPGRLRTRRSEPVQKIAADNTNSTVGNGGRRRVSRSKSFHGETRNEEDAEVFKSTTLSARVESTPPGVDYPAWLKNTAEDGKFSTDRLPKQITLSRRTVIFQDPPEMISTPSANEQHDDSSGMFVAEDTPPAADAPRRLSSSPAKQFIEAEIMEENRRAKMMAMQELHSDSDAAEDGLFDGDYQSDTVDVAPSPPGASFKAAASHITSPNVRNQFTRNMNFKSASASHTPIPETESSSPEAPRGKLLSIAEKRALEGRKVKIVADKSKEQIQLAATRAAGTSGNGILHVASARPQDIPRAVISISRAKEEPIDFGFESVSGISSDDDDSIPAVRPAKIRPALGLNDRSLLSASGGRGRGGIRGRGRGRGRGRQR